MPSACGRRRNPEAVRQKLLNQACAIAAQRGLDGVTVAAVATAAGVTKGALFHHFSTKDALIEAMFDEQLRDLKYRIEATMDTDPERRGRFTRAYVLAATSACEHQQLIWRALAGVLVPGSKLCDRWHAWLHEQLQIHKETDGGLQLEIVRLAADGAWMTAMTRSPLPNLHEIQDRLVAMTASIDSSGTFVSSRTAATRQQTDLAS